MIINERAISSNASPFIIAEIGAAHNSSLHRCCTLIEIAKQCNADAVKFQAFTPDSITLQSDRPEFTVQAGPWKGKVLYDLYRNAQTPREWFPELFGLARQNGLATAVSVFSKDDTDFVRQFNPDLLKIASFEINDLPLIEYAASQGRPLLLSLGMATEEEAWEAIDAARDGGLDAGNIKRMHCISSYPATVGDFALSRIQPEDGISDHTIGIELPVAAVTRGASLIERHLTLNRADGLDDCFASEPQEFSAMVKAVRATHAALVRDGEAVPSHEHRALRRSLFAVQNIPKGAIFTSSNVRSIRPGHGLPPANIELLLGRQARQAISAGTPLSWEHIENE